MKKNVHLFGNKIDRNINIVTHYLVILTQSVRHSVVASVRKTIYVRQHSSQERIRSKKTVNRAVVSRCSKSEVLKGHFCFILL